MEVTDLLKAFDESDLIAEILRRGNFEVCTKEVLNAVRDLEKRGYFDRPGKDVK